MGHPGGAAGGWRGSDEKVISRWSDLYRSQLVEFEVDGAAAFVVKPRKPAQMENARGFGMPLHLESTMDSGRCRPNGMRKWYRPSWTRAFISVACTWVNRTAVPLVARLLRNSTQQVVKRFGLAKRACLFPVSRGGLMHYNWAAEHPELVRCIGAIYPVCDTSDRPGLTKASKIYGIPEKQLAAEWDKHNPLERLAPLAAAQVPILHLHGDSDDVVPLDRHSAELRGATGAWVVRSN